MTNGELKRPWWRDARRIAALVMAVLLPTGSGLAFLGRWRAVLYAVAVLVLYAALLWRPLVAAAGMFVLWLVSFVDTARAPAERPVRRWPPIAAVVAFVAVTGGARLSMKAFVVETFRMPSESMAPTLRQGDVFVVDKRGGTPRRGDVIVFRSPQDRGVDFVKRVVALPGEEISLRGGRLGLDGKDYTHGAETCSAEVVPGGQVPPNCILIREGHVDWALYTVLQTNRTRADFPRAGESCPAGMTQQRPHRCTVPEGRVFVLGDHRDDSYDSRDFGAVPLEDVKGRATKISFSYADGTVRRERFGLRIR